MLRMPQMMEIATLLAERTPLPDAVIRFGMRSFISGVEREPDVLAGEFAQRMDSYAIAEHTDTANAQHYEIPNEFFGLFLGPHRKYSSAFYPTGRESLAEAEALALTQTCSNAALVDGQDILELGCGWGSLSLWMAAQYPKARIVSVSNSASQRIYIQEEARKRGITNLAVLTCDMNVFEPGKRFDRIVSVEMFEHMANWRQLLARVRDWIKPDGRLFLHIFAHTSRPSYYSENDDNWMARHFFTGGIMPSVDLIRQYPPVFQRGRGMALERHELL